jgi:hypothetical protein
LTAGAAQAEADGEGGAEEISFNFHGYARTILDVKNPWL